MPFVASVCNNASLHMALYGGQGVPFGRSRCGRGELVVLVVRAFWFFLLACSGARLCVVGWAGWVWVELR